MGGTNRQVKRPDDTVSPVKMIVQLEIFAVVFTTSAWSCWYDYIDPRINAVGWGYEFMLHEFCKYYRNTTVFNIGILNRIMAFHRHDMPKIRGSEDWKSKGTINFDPDQQEYEFKEHTKRLIGN